MNSSPHELAEQRITLSNEYATLSEELQSILLKKPIVWTEIRARENVKSDTQADRKWEATEDGIREIIIRLQLKALEKKMSSIRTMLEVLSGEARNQY